MSIEEGMLACGGAPGQASRRFRGAVIGLGKMGVLHGGILRALPSVELCAVCEPERTVADFVRAFVPGVRVYKDHETLLREEHPDFAFICTPPASHVPIALKCVEAGTAIFIEKPLTTDASQAETLLDALRTNPVTNAVGFMKRYADTFCRAREMLKSGALGQVISCEAETAVSQLFQRGSGWRYAAAEAGGGVLIGQGVHALDLLCWFLGMPTSGNARLRGFYSEGVEDFAWALLDWGGGTTGCLRCSWSVDNRRMMETSLTLTGEYGTLWVNDDAVKLFVRTSHHGWARGWTVENKPKLHRGVPIDIGGPEYTRQDQAFVAAVAGGEAAAPDVKAAHMVQRVVDRLYESARSNGATVAFEAD